MKGRVRTGNRRCRSSTSWSFPGTSFLSGFTSECGQRARLLRHLHAKAFGALSRLGQDGAETEVGSGPLQCGVGLQLWSMEHSGFV